MNVGAFLYFISVAGFLCLKRYRSHTGIKGTKVLKRVVFGSDDSTNNIGRENQHNEYALKYVKYLVSKTKCRFVIVLVGLPGSGKSEIHAIRFKTLIFYTGARKIYFCKKD